LFHVSKLNTFQQIDDKFHPRSTCKATLANIQWKFTNQIHQSFSKYNPIFRSEATTVEKPMLRSERDRCAANEQWRFQCDDGRRIAIKTALNRRIEDGRERPEDEAHLFLSRLRYQRPAALLGSQQWDLKQVTSSGNVRMYKEWNKKKVKARTTRSRTREDKRELIFTKKFQCTKTGFERCAMQITITIKI
ncbi:hypothetical protein T01_5760, partial [Trichinella spiralis]